MSEIDHPAIKLRSAFQTDIGVVREHNEDSAAVDDEADFFVVADGMGGHAAGEVASAMAVETVAAELAEARALIKAFGRKPTDKGRKELVSVLEAAVRKAHSAVYERGIREPDKQGMGTTLDVVLLAGPEAFVAHVGDSRTYLIRDGKAAQITTDHTVAEVLVIEGKLSIEEAAVSPLRTILVNAIGVAPDVGVEMAHVRLRTDDQLLLCSDGLHDYFPTEGELAEHIAGAKPEDALDAMVELAKARGGHDNITGIIVEVLDAPPDDFSASPFEVDLTQPAIETSDGVPEAVSSGDTLPHELVDESDLGEESDDTQPVVTTSADPDEDLKSTIPMRPLTTKPSVDARKKLERASTIPPEGEGEADAREGELDTLPLEPTEPGAEKPTADAKKGDAKKDDAKKDDAKAGNSDAKAKAAKAGNSDAKAKAAKDGNSDAKAKAAKDDAKADNAKAAKDDAKADNAKADNAKADNAKADNAKADNAKADNAKADNAKADNAKAAKSSNGDVVKSASTKTDDTTDGAKKKKKKKKRKKKKSGASAKKKAP